jgi:twitching motility protein PilU
MIKLGAENANFDNDDMRLTETEEDNGSLYK